MGKGHPRIDHSIKEKNHLYDLAEHVDEANYRLNGFVRTLKDEAQDLGYRWQSNPGLSSSGFNKQLVMIKKFLTLRIASWINRDFPLSV